MATGSISENGDHEMGNTATNGDVAEQFKPFTTAERIQQLSDIDKSIGRLLMSSGLALRSLALCQGGADSVPATVQASKDAFKTSTEAYLDRLHSVNIHFKRNSAGLKEAGIIPDRKQEDEDDVALSGFAAADKSREMVNTTLNVGWLNSRSGKVGLDYEAELWAQAREFFEAREERRQAERKSSI